MKKIQLLLSSLVWLPLFALVISPTCEAVPASASFVTQFHSYTEYEKPSTGFPNGRTIVAHVFVPETPHADMPLMVMNHGSSGVYGSVNDLADGNLIEAADEWPALLTRMGYVMVILDSYTSRGFVRDDKLIYCHDTRGEMISSSSCTPGQLAAGYLDESSYRFRGEALVTATDCGNPCVSNAQQRAYDTNYAADHFASAAFQAELQQHTNNPLASVDSSRFYLFGHSDGGVTTIAAMFHGHADGHYLPSRGISVDSAYPRPDRYVAAVAFYPGCYMHGAYRENGNSVYYPYAPLLILHGNADDLYRPNDGLVPYHCEQLLTDSHNLMQQEGIDIPFEMVVYTAEGQLSQNDRPGISHGFDRAYWNDTQYLDWLIPEHMSKVHADATMLKFFSLHPDPTGNNLAASSLRAGAIPYQAFYYPSLPPTWMRNPLENIVVDPNNVAITLPDFVQNPYFYDVPGNPDISRVTEPSDFAIAYAVTGLPPDDLVFNAPTYSITGRLDSGATSPSAFWVIAENKTGRYRQQLLLHPNGHLQLGPGYRVDTVNGVMRSSGLINVELDLYLSAVPGAASVHWVNSGTLPGGVVVTNSNTLEVNPDRFTLPATINVVLDVNGLLMNETLVVERVVQPGYDTFNRVRFESHYAALQTGTYPAQNYDNDSPMSGDGYGYDPDDGGVPSPNEGGGPGGLPPGEGIFSNGFE